MDSKNMTIAVLTGSTVQLDRLCCLGGHRGPGWRLCIGHRRFQR
jgi:hypothetical protein